MPVVNIIRFNSVENIFRDIIAKRTLKIHLVFLFCFDKDQSNLKDMVLANTIVISNKWDLANLMG
jgi:hypothetical protein